MWAPQHSGNASGPESLVRSGRSEQVQRFRHGALNRSEGEVAPRRWTVLYRR